MIKRNQQEQRVVGVHAEDIQVGDVVWKGDHHLTVRDVRKRTLSDGIERVYIYFEGIKEALRRRTRFRVTTIVEG